MAFSEIPIGLALIPCDTIIDDKRTGKKSLIGIISQITTTLLPAVLPTMGIMVSFTGGMGTYSCEIHCRCSSLDKPVFKMNGDVKFDHPNQVIEMIFQLVNLQFPVAGVYTLEVFIDDILIMTRPLPVVQRELKKGRKKSPPDMADPNKGFAL